MVKGKARRAIELAQAEAMTKPRKSHKSRYARKAAYLKSQGGWGWQYGQEDGKEKPWR